MKNLSHNNFLCFICFLFSLLSSELLANQILDTDYSIHQLENLPQNDVNYIFRDSKGFMWIGTLDGLHRFDGYTFRTYRISDDLGSISSNMIIAIDEDSHGNLWIGTYGKGLCKLNPITEKFTNYNSFGETNFALKSDDVTCLMVDLNDVIWVGNWFGVTRITFDENINQIVDMAIIPNSVFFNTSYDIETKSIHQDKYGEIWVGTNFTIAKISNVYACIDSIEFDIFKCKANALYDYENGLLVGGDKISAIQRQPDGKYNLNELYNISSDALIYHNQKIWTGNRSGISCLKYSPNRDWQIQYHADKESSANQFGSNIVTSIFEDEIGQIWVGMRGGGVSTINLNSQRFKHYYNTNHKGSVGSNFIQCVFEDHSKNLWLGTEDRGVSFLKNNKPNSYCNGFINVRINSLVNEDRAYCIEEVMTPHSLKHKSIIWVGTSDPTHLIAIDPTSFKKLQLPTFINDIDFVFALEGQGDSILWVGTYGDGLWKLGLNKEAEIETYLHFTPDDKRESSILSYIIRSILVDRSNNLWIGTDKGLNRISAEELDKSNPIIETFVKGAGSKNLSHDYILDIYEAFDGRIWFGTMGGGLISYSKDDTGDYSFSTLGEKDGLPNNSVKSILEDDKGLLWLGTNNGLTRYNPFNGDIVNYDVEDGLQNKEFSELCAYKRSNGQLVFGGINGFNVFYPKKIFKDTLKPKLFLTDFYISNDVIKPGQSVNGRVVLKESIEYTKEIKLKYNQNSFSIGFLGLHYKAPQKNKYKYILEGFDQKWNNASALHRIAKYTNIPAGEYTFKVLGSNSDNIWIDKPVSIKLSISPPIYLSKLAYFIYALVLIIISYIGYRTLWIIAKKKKDLLISSIEKRKVEEIAQIKLRFFTNISHEFRTPLTLITTPLEKLIAKNDELDSTQRLRSYNVIKQNADLMLRLINQLMDFRRLDQDKMKLRAEKGELNRFVENIYSSFIPLAEQKNIGYLFEPAIQDIIVWFDRDKLEKVIYNLLSNAFKFTPKNGSVTIKVVDTIDDKVAIIVTDTGLGIEKAEHEHIFERYYQPDRKSKQVIGGTGIGLALTKGLVELHKGVIEVVSSKRTGSTFKVILNKGKDWLDSEFNQIESESAATVKQLDEELLVEPDEQDDFEKDIVITRNRYKILIVEDNTDLRNVISDIFNDDFIVFLAEDGLQGIKICKERLPDIIISDIMMPNMNGIELCQKIKTDEAISHILVLLLTAKSTVESQIEGFEIGADAYISKPFSSELLRTRVISLIKNREKFRAKFQRVVEINPKIIANSPADSKFLDQVLAIIEDNLSETGFTVEKLANIYGVSRINLNRKIKSLTGETANEFLRNIRLKHAAELLSQNVLTVSEITWQVGYNDLRTFRTRFKEKFGISPSEYSKKFQK